ncbi:MAG TPA: hypothetical protein VF803_02835 [Candidatus Paceibacterota bacterium]
MHSPLIGLIITYRYVILFPLAAFEGPILSVMVGFLVATGYFNPLIAYGIMILGDVIPDGAYYFFGRWGRDKAFIQRYGARFGLTEHRFAVIERLWHKHPGKTMWTSKLSYGLSTAFLVSAGLAGMRLSTFYAYALPVTMVQYGLLMAAGYFFGNSYALISEAFSGFEAIIAAAVVAGAVYYAVTRFMSMRLKKEEKEEEDTGADDAQK